MTGFVVKDNCTVVAPDGHEFQEFSCTMPSLAPLYFSFEKYHEADEHYVFNYVPVKNFLDSNKMLPIFAVAAYVLFCYFGQKFMEKRESFKLRYSLAAWNLLLTLYSFYTVIRGAHALHNLSTKSLKRNLCDHPATEYGGSTDIAIVLFILSKYAELFDTVFIVLNKKPLILLHWWHHISVLLYCNVFYRERTPSAVFFGPINACVHSVMYFYYFLMAIKLKPKWFNAMWITVFQLAQMVMGTCVSLASLYYHVTDEDCYVTSNSMWFAFLMYLSYLYLFGAFFYRRYFDNAKLAHNKKE